MVEWVAINYQTFDRTEHVFTIKQIVLKWYLGKKRKSAEIAESTQMLAMILLGASKK